MQLKQSRCCLTRSCTAQKSLVQRVFPNTAQHTGCVNICYISHPYQGFWTFAKNHFQSPCSQVDELQYLYETLYHVWCIMMLYIALNCALVSVVLVFEAEQSYSQTISWGCGRIIIESIYLQGNRPSSGSIRKESIAHTFCLLPTEQISIDRNPSKWQWCQAPTLVYHVFWVCCRNYCRLIVQHGLPCVLSTTLYTFNCSEKVMVQLTDAPTNYLPTIYLIPTTLALRLSGSGQPLAMCYTFWCQWTSWWVCSITCETTECLYNYLVLVFINCYGDYAPVEGTIVDIHCTRHCNTYDVLWCYVLHWIMHHFHLSWCSKESCLVLKSFRGAVGELLSKVSSHRDAHPSFLELFLCHSNIVYRLSLISISDVKKCPDGSLTMVLNASRCWLQTSWL